MTSKEIIKTILAILYIIFLFITLTTVVLFMGAADSILDNGTMLYWVIIIAIEIGALKLINYIYEK